MANPHINYATFKSRFGDLGITEWTKYNYLSNYNFGLPAQTEVPSEYLELESITGKSTTYIKIPFQFSTPNFRIELDSAITETADRTALSFVTTSYYSLAYGRGFSGKIFGTNNNIVDNGYLVWYNTSKDKLHAVITHTTYTVNGANYNEIGSTGTFPSYDEVTNLLLFKIQESSSNGGDGVTIYKVVVYENGIKVLDLHPVRRLSDGAIGMYDTVTKSFFGNAGTGSFTAGPMKQRYVRVEYVQGNGNDYIDLGIKVGNTHGFELTTSIANTTDEILFGHQGVLQIGANGEDNITKVYYGWNGVNTSAAVRHPVALNSKHTYQLNYYNSRKSLVDGVEDPNLVLNYSTLAISPNSLTILGRRETNNSVEYMAFANIYSFRITDGNALIHSFVPVYDLVTEKYGLFDLVSGTFYGSVNGLLTGPWTVKKLSSQTWTRSIGNPGGFWSTQTDAYTWSKGNEAWIIDLTNKYHTAILNTATVYGPDKTIGATIPELQYQEFRFMDKDLVSEGATIGNRLDYAWIFLK